MAALITFGMAANIVLVDEFSTSRLTVLLVGVFIILIQFYRRMHYCREAKVYTLLFLLALSSLAWTPNPNLGQNSLFPMFNFLLLLIIYDSMCIIYPFRTILIGSMSGFLGGAALTTAVFNFPFEYSQEFSYNAFSVMYLFGLYLSLVLALSVNNKIIPLIIGLLATAHVFLTTSIKANLGLALAFLVWLASARKQIIKKVKNKKVISVALISAITCFIISQLINPEYINYAFQRLVIGIDVLKNQADVQGYSGFEERQDWARASYVGILKNPFFGSGVEGFRAIYGITSHSTPVDLIFNFGFVGFILFYSVLVSVIFKAFNYNKIKYSSFCSLILASTACVLFMTLSGTLFYNTYIAAFLGISVAFLDSKKWKSKKLVFQ